MICPHALSTKLATALARLIMQLLTGTKNPNLKIKQQLKDYVLWHNRVLIKFSHQLFYSTNDPYSHKMF